MIRNYLRIALRTLRRTMGHTVINVVGLAVAMATCLLTWLYVQEELSYDDFHPEADRIHAVTIDFGSSETRRTPDALGSLLATKVPGIQEVAQVGGDGREQLVQWENREGQVEEHLRVLTTDSTFFDVFAGFEITRGNPDSSFGTPGQVVISESVAQTVFEDGNPIGQSLAVGDEGKRLYTVAGVVEVPSNSTLQFDILVPEGEGTLDQPWKLFGFHTYVKTDANTELDNLTETVAAAAPSGIADKLEKVGLLPLPDLYLSGLYSTSSFRGQTRYLYLFGTVALLILVIAGINYVNLVLARANRRAHEVGVRKTVGAHRTQLAGQFLLEIGLLSVVALAAAIGLVEAVLPTFNELFNTSLTLATARHGTALLTGSVFVLAVTFLAGIYPAFVLSGFSPTRILRGQTTSGGGGTWLRKGLVIAQFAASAGLILGTTVVYQQLGYLQDKHLGFEAEQVVTVDLGEVDEAQHSTVWREVRRHPAVVNAAVSGGVPGGFFGSVSKDPSDFSPEADATGDFQLHLAKVDTNYVETLGLTLLQGQNFSGRNDEAQDRRFILNKAAVQALGWEVEEAIGKSFSLDLGGEEGAVIGVVDNFHVESLHNAFAPVALHLDGPTFGQGTALLARFASEEIREGMDHIEQVVTSAASGNAFSYTFLDDRFDQMYRSEERLARIFTGFALMAIIIACMGLFGLSAFTVQRRTKEIGIRKALGATTMRIVGLLSKDYAILVGVALLAGIPGSYVGMQWWLQDFAFRMDLGAGPFIATALLVLTIAGLTVSAHALRAAWTDPAAALRDE